MTKRKPGAFPISINELYNTPPKATDVLIPHLRQEDVKTFAEPCVGEGMLKNYLETKGFKCVAEGDIATGLDARHWSRDMFKGVDIVITNTPWTHELMVEIILAQTFVVPGWFLTKSDWMLTHQSGDLMWSHCTDVVPIGRVKWFPDSDSVGFDNCCWFRMDSRKGGGMANFWPMFNVIK